MHVFFSPFHRAKVAPAIMSSYCVHRPLKYSHTCEKQAQTHRWQITNTNQAWVSVCDCVCNHTKRIRRAGLAACWHHHARGIYRLEHLWCQMCSYGWKRSSSSTSHLIQLCRCHSTAHSEWRLKHNKRESAPAEVLWSMRLNDLRPKCPFGGENYPWAHCVKSKITVQTR